MSTFPLEIVTPTKILDEGDISYLRCPAPDGLFGIMSNHRPALITIVVGEIKITKNGKESYLATSGGYADIRKEKVQLLLETVERSQEIDTGRAETAFQRAKQRLSSEGSDADHVSARGSVVKTLTRLQVARRK
ncbi:MAG: ATP synthase F1 subunit epsilon [Candidatus Marinimicrobia bacterium]|jgi:F-type H+-transporting ATPase subunit epsilon|nr:ATP synthase F1 subunit epsilon [Candidatus Neomarinimicrobiota bacterium]MDP6457373.1 ATP synthase F1 subunit epsilon [Candidatus Neomarinimicrobiota bacterium]MDP6593505.1 ATP synthase F1 subunit epsilon [Candidatus Neomarinimicrobiota bacterium]MDP6836315.1 ATP synthase F1 subunit epsilon [Candidatus Neomarinimicrobiota bacterium]MDP6966757.1 ATP synthase F1 subunit epsilon [Candidatus Neomarinimicrobiota bacterium]|tara:strand:- start:2728 stop:3129 length:402 start_codon:yes stop_codon:yes gene_type:complete